MKIIEVEKKPLFFEEEKLSPEETKYRSALELMESVECILRYEKGVEALNAAAEIFEELEDYKDSRERAKDCREQAVSLQETGREQAYQEAVQMLEQARTKMDYRTVISEFDRFPDYKDSQERIEMCRKKLKRLASIQVWKNRGIIVAVLAVIAVIFWLSPAMPFTKGLIRMKQGHYQLAIRHFNEAGGFLNSKNLKKRCRYHQALNAYEKGDIEKASQLCLLARGNEGADRLQTKIELDAIRKAKVGGIVPFGKKTWQILDMDEDGKRCIMIQAHPLTGRIFDEESGQWEQSGLRHWLNKKFKNNCFNQMERKLLMARSRAYDESSSLEEEEPGAFTEEGEEITDKVSLLSKKEWEVIQNNFRAAIYARAGEHLSGEKPTVEYGSVKINIEGEPYAAYQSMVWVSGTRDGQIPVLEMQEPKSKDTEHVEDAEDMTTWWLKDAGDSDQMACYIDEDDSQRSSIGYFYLRTNGDIQQERGVRPVIIVSLDEQRMEESESNTP